MSVNFSSSLNTTFDAPSLHSSVSFFYADCSEFTVSIVIYSTYTFTNVLLLPLYILILCMGFQRWRRPGSALAGQSTSHSDVFTYHIVTVEILGVLGGFIYTLSVYVKNQTMLISGTLIFCIIFPGQTLFHLLTCVERYLAVVHPITYMRLRETGGVRIRNIVIVCVWLKCFGWVGLAQLYLPDLPFVPLFCMFAVSVIVIFFCCLSVLCVLTHSGPGQVGGTEARVDQSKQRAFHVISAITGVLLLRFFGLLVTFGVAHFKVLHQEGLCALMDFGIYLTLPSSLVLPLLFLHKTGKLPRCRRNTESG